MSEYSSNSKYQGITTIQYTIGVSAVTKIPDGAGVVDIVIFGTTGGTVYMTGVSLSVANILTNGVRIPNNIPHYMGSANLFMAAETSAAIVFVAKKLSAGFTGIGTLNGE